MRKLFVPRPDRRPPAPSDNPEPTPIEILINLFPEYLSPRAREERRQMAAGNPEERQIRQHRISREESRYRRGFPVAGHGEPEPVNDPRVRRRLRF